MLQDLECSCKT